MQNDHEFDPITPEQEAEQERQAELARRIRREVLRVQRGQADEDIKADEQEQAQEQAAQLEAEHKEQQRHASLLGRIISGSILVRDGRAYIRPVLGIAVMFFLSIAVMFWTLYLDIRYTQTERQVQMLREQSVRLQEQRCRQTTHSAIVERLLQQNIELYDPLAPNEMIEN